MKHLMKLLFVPFLLFFSCTTQVDGVLNDGDLPQNNEDASVEATLHPVGISFSKSSIAAFAEEGISEIGILCVHGRFSYIWREATFGAWCY